MINFFSIYGNQLVPIFLAILAYFFGLRAFYLQREYELVRQRYLSEGVDLFAANMEHALRVDMELFQRSFNILRQFRESGREMPQSILKEQSPRLEMGRLQSGTSYRMQTLTGSQAFWDGAQLLYVMTQEFLNFYNDELVHTISGITAGEYELATTEEEFIQLTETAITAFHTAISDNFHKFLFLIQGIGEELESRRFNLKTIRDFQRRARIRKVITDVEALIEEIKQRPRINEVIDAESKNSSDGRLEKTG